VIGLPTKNLILRTKKQKREKTKNEKKRNKKQKTGRGDSGGKHAMQVALAGYRVQ